MHITAHCINSVNSLYALVVQVKSKFYNAFYQSLLNTIMLSLTPFFSDLCKGINICILLEPLTYVIVLCVCVHMML